MLLLFLFIFPSYRSLMVSMSPQSTVHTLLLFLAKLKILWTEAWFSSLIRLSEQNPYLQDVKNRKNVTLTSLNTSVLSGGMNHLVYLNRRLEPVHNGTMSWKIKPSDWLSVINRISLHG